MFTTLLCYGTTSVEQDGGVRQEGSRSRVAASARCGDLIFYTPTVRNLSSPHIALADARDRLLSSSLTIIMPHPSAHPRPTFLEYFVVVWVHQCSYVPSEFRVINT